MTDGRITDVAFDWAIPGDHDDRGSPALPGGVRVGRGQAELDEVPEIAEVDPEVGGDEVELEEALPLTE